MTRRVKSSHICTYNLSVQGQKRKSILLSEFGIYKAIFNSHKPEAEEFQEWVFTTIKKLREAAGLEAYETFRMMDKDVQKKAMAKLSKVTDNKVDYVKANTIANKAVSNRYSFQKMVKKCDMSPDMLVDREKALVDTVNLMSMAKQYNLDINVKDKIYNMYN